MSMVESRSVFKPARIIVIMGVSGCGKSSVGEELSKQLDVQFLDGDGYHPPANKEKMRQGIPLVDDDRWPWLDILANALKESAGKNAKVVGACSALRRTYRDYLTEQAGEPIAFIHLSGTKELIMSRIGVREHEYMPTSLLDSQFATLEVPKEDENVLTVSIDQTIKEIVEEVYEVTRGSSPK